MWFYTANGESLNRKAWQPRGKLTLNADIGVIGFSIEDIKCRYAQIDGFDDYYVTELGDIYSKRPRGGNGERNPPLRKLVPKNPGKDCKYFNIVLCNDNGMVTKSIHRLVAQYFVDGYFEGAVVNHIDGNNRNNVASNLEWTTVKDNVHKSYLTSGVGAKRNYKEWNLFDKNDNHIGVFYSIGELFKYIEDNDLDIAPHQLVKNCHSRGYKVVKQ